MTEPSDGPHPEPKRSGPKPVRAAAAGSSDEAARSKPTPVRAMAAVDAPPPPVEPDLEEATLDVEEAEWKVRVVGRAGGGRPSATPMLLLGFWPASDDEGGHEREALVVGRSLAEMTPAALHSAFESSGPPPPPREPVRESKGRGRRGRGGRPGGRGS